MRLSCYWQWISSSHCQSSLRIHSAIASWIHSYFDNVMTKFMINNKTDARKTDVNLLNIHWATPRAIERRVARSAGAEKKEKASPHFLLVSFPNFHNINPRAKNFRNKNRLLVVYLKDKVKDFEPDISQPSKKQDSFFFTWSLLSCFGVIKSSPICPRHGKLY